MAEAAPLDPEQPLRLLARHRYVLIGALAARLQGFPRLTTDADVTPESSAENLGHLSAALRELDARVYTESVPEGLPFDCHAKTLARAPLWHFVTSAGRLHVAFQPAGTEGFADLAREAIRFEVFGVELLVASLADILRSKKAADPPQDRQDVVVLRESSDARSPVAGAAPVARDAAKRALGVSGGVSRGRAFLREDTPAPLRLGHPVDPPH